mgnify:CR=1 FL=1
MALVEVSVVIVAGVLLVVIIAEGDRQCDSIKDLVLMIVRMILWVLPVIIEVAIDYCDSSRSSSDSVDDSVLRVSNVMS